MVRRRVLPDTNVFIDEARGVGALVGRPLGDAIFLSAVVLKELRFGIGRGDVASRRAFSAFVRRFERLGRIVAPSSGVFERAGAVLRSMREAGQEWQSASAFGDVLIALSARELGAVVLTRDRDFALIRRHERFALELIP